MEIFKTTYASYSSRNSVSFDVPLRRRRGRKADDLRREAETLSRHQQASGRQDRPSRQYNPIEGAVVARDKSGRNRDRFRDAETVDAERAVEVRRVVSEKGRQADKAVLRRWQEAIKSIVGNGSICGRGSVAANIQDSSYG